MTDTRQITNDRGAILDQARAAITVDRQAHHGDAEDNFANIATLWSWWLSARSDIGPLSAFDVAVMMDLFKTARVAANPLHMDNFVDKAGYSAIAGEIAQRSPKTEGEATNV